MRILLAAALIAAPTIAHAATYEFDTTNNGKTTKSTAVLAPKALCMTTDVGAAPAKGGKMIFVQDPPVIYYERAGKIEKMDQARIDQMKQQLQSLTGSANPNMQKMIEEALAKVPEAQREMMRKQMEKSMGGMMPKSNGVPKERKYVATAKMGTVKGYHVTEYTVMEDGKKVGTAMMTPASSLPQGKEMMARLNSMMDFVKGMMSQFGVNGPTQTFMNLPKGYFPVSCESYDENGHGKQTFNLAKATKDTPDDCKAPE